MISLSLPFLHIVCHPSSHSVISLSLFFSSSNTTYSHHFLTSKEEGQKLSRDKSISRKGLILAIRTILKQLQGIKGRTDISCISTKRNILFLTVLGVGPKACVDVRGCRRWALWQENRVGIWLLAKVNPPAHAQSGSPDNVKYELKYPKASRKIKERIFNNVNLNSALFNNGVRTFPLQMLKNGLEKVWGIKSLCAIKRSAFGIS